MVTGLTSSRLSSILPVTLINGGKLVNNYGARMSILAGEIDSSGLNSRFINRGLLTIGYTDRVQTRSKFKVRTGWYFEKDKLGIEF